MSKFVVITGSSGGIGSALVQTYLKDGYCVIGLDRCNSGSQSEGNFIEINLNLEEFSKNKHYREKILDQIKSYLPKELKEFILINNAAEQIVKNIFDLDWQDWQSSFAVNTIAPFFLAQGLIENLRKTHGHIINISSIHSKLTKVNFSCYAASKSALESLTRSLALELSPEGISVNAIMPAAIATKMLKEGFFNAPDKFKELERYHPARSIGTPKQLAAFVKSITKLRGEFLTGSIIDFTGGISGQLSDPDI